MKNLIKITALAFGVGLSGFANAQSDAFRVVTETPTFLAVYNVSPETNRIRVYLSKQDGNESKLFMHLYDDHNMEIYSRKFGKNEKQSVVLLSLREVPDGNYTLEISDKYGSKSQVFKKGHEEVVVKNTATLVAIK